MYAIRSYYEKVVETFNIPIYEKAGFEADDVIGTLANQAQQQKENIETIIVTGDMDALQLVNEKTKVFTMRRGLSDSVLFDEKAVWEKYSFSPDQLRDFKGLRGDPSDNIPGVKGVGEKTATGLRITSYNVCYTKLLRKNHASKRKKRYFKLYHMF